MNRPLSLLLLALAILLGVRAVPGAEGLKLSEFILRFGQADKGLAASGLRVDAARGTKAGQGYLSLPSLEFDLRAPYRSWGRSYQYEAYQDKTYLGYYEYREESYRMQLGLSQSRHLGKYGRPKRAQGLDDHIMVFSLSHCHQFLTAVFCVRFKCTCMAMMAAGVMPDIREAWPRERGLTLFNFSLTSVERP